MGVGRVGAERGTDLKSDQRCVFCQPAWGSRALHLKQNRCVSGGLKHSGAALHREVEEKLHRCQESQSGICSVTCLGKSFLSELQVPD